ncbi:MAG TPA: helicase-related protein, partial [Candidatus Hydrogenedentes bacterium]|nr:helicase-related protein [Candidatus Hydrogenedentota bacterium]
MSRLEDLTPGSAVQGVLPDAQVTVVSVKWYGTENIELIYKGADGKPDSRVLGREEEDGLKVVSQGNPWTFDGDGNLFRLVSEAQRINLAHLFDPLLAIHSSNIDPLPHQITAVYERMLPRQPLRFLLADDPGSGKTIMAGLLIRELIARADVERCLIVCPGSLAEQWQDELYEKFHLRFEILTNDKLESAPTGNWFQETPLVIARLDKLSRNEDVQQKLEAPECGWDLVVCDEAHKMSATVFGSEVKYTKRYRLGQLLSRTARHFLLMTATPHNGKEEDFQLFMALVDGDRFEGGPRTGGRSADASDLMRRMDKESLLTFEGKPLFPERIAYTLDYKLSEEESALYQQVTEYVREEFNRADALENGKQKGTVGFALTILQRRLASSPEAIYQSLRRRRERLDGRLKEMEVFHRGLQAGGAVEPSGRLLDDDDIEDLEDAPENEVEEMEEEVLDQATAARTIAELQMELETLRRLEAAALKLRESGNDTKWRQLADLLDSVFKSSGAPVRVCEDACAYGGGEVPPPVSSAHQKLVLFTEHRDTLNYLQNRITRLLGRDDAVVVIHGAMLREARMDAQGAFRNDPRVQVLLATDAAGEGINLQRAHLMVNYDLPWNPNRIEQRFGRIHRIGQREVCHLWNLVAGETREGEVYRHLLKKLDQARQALGGRVFDVLGKLQFDGEPLRSLLIKAIRYGDSPEVRARMDCHIETSTSRESLLSLMENQALVSDVMDAARVRRIREDMERAEARRLQPHYIESFFLAAFRSFGGEVREREPRRYEITRVPQAVRLQAVPHGLRDPVQNRYERVVFEKSLVSPHGVPAAAFVCPGHPLMDAVISLTLERHRTLLKRGALLVDERDPGTAPRVLFYLEHSVRDGRLTRSGQPHTVSRRVLFVELGQDGAARHVQYAPYLDYRPLAEGDPGPGEILARPECAWISRAMEQDVEEYAVTRIVPAHLREVKEARIPLVERTEAAVKDRLQKEINHWDHRAAQLKAQEQAGKTNARINWQEARRRADVLQERLKRRLAELEKERFISALSPVVLGGVQYNRSGTPEAT